MRRSAGASGFIGVALVVLAGASAAFAQGEVAVAVGRGPQFLVAAARPSQPPVPVDAASVPALRRRVALDLDDVGRAEALDAISRASGLRLVYASGVTLREGRVQLKAAAITVAAALTEVLLDAGVDVLLAPSGNAVLVKRTAVRVTATGTISGRVTDAKTSQVIAGVEVLLEGTRWRTATDTGGRYRLADVAAGSYTLVVRRFGYARRSRAVTVTADREEPVDLALDPMPTKLEELVTTATGPQRRLEVANAVTLLRADSIVQTQPIKDVTDLLDTRVPGLAVLPTTGAPGDPSRLRLRGSSSILRSNDPIVIVDGVRIYAEQSNPRSASLAWGFSTSVPDEDGAQVPAPSPLDRIDPNSIEKIEVLNGPSAATLYGADAANGVIVITTKRGQPGPARWDISVGHGRTSMPGRFPDAYFGFAHTLNGLGPDFCLLGGGRDPTCVVDSVVAYQVLNDPELTVLGQGHSSHVSTTVSGGRSDVTYAVTGSYSDEVGLLKLPQYEVDRYREVFGRDPEDWMRRPHQLTKWSVSSQVEFRPARTTTLGLTMSLAGDEQPRSNLEQQLLRLRAQYVDKATGQVYEHIPGSPTNTLVPDFYRKTTNRALGVKTGLSFQWQPLRRLTLGATAGLGIDLRRDESLLPARLRPGAQDSAGFLATGQGNATLGSANVQAMYSDVPLGLGFKAGLAAGFNYTSTSIADLRRRVDDPTGGPGSSSESSQTAYDLTSYGWYVAPRLGNQRFFLDLGLRLDGGSEYGANVGFSGFALPKLGFSWLISDEPFFPLRNSSILNSLKIRAAYGQAGVQPGPTDRLRLYSQETPTLEGQAVGIARLLSLGNTRLRPERSTEFEWGFDADLADGRLSIGFTTYRKTKDDALLNAPVSPSVGGGTVTVNIGKVRNTGVELVLGTNLVRTALVQWSTHLNVSHNRNTVVSLAEDLEAFSIGGSTGQRVVVGYPLFGYWERPIVGYADANNDHILQPHEVIRGDSAAYLGTPEPTYMAGLHTTLGLFHGAVTVTGSFDYQDDFTQQQSLEGIYGPLARARVDPTAPLADQALVADGNYYPFQTLSLLRFNELSIGWRLPLAVVRWAGAERGSVAVQGTNLALITNYHGKDPRVNSLVASNNVLDAGALPRPREWRVRVGLSY